MMDRIETNCTVRAEPPQVADLFWNIQHWYAIWNPIEAITVTYDDGAHQEFQMLVWRDHHLEAIRTIRFREGNQAIRLFSPTPPPMLERHRGEWCFADLGGQCRITAVREYELRRAPGESPTLYRARRISFRRSFSARLVSILNRFSLHFGAEWDQMEAEKNHHDSL